MPLPRVVFLPGVGSIRSAVTTHHLEMLSPLDLRPGRRPAADFELRQARIPCPELNRFLYVAVGAAWHWYERLGWTRERWLEYLDRPSLETWIGYVSGTPAGYFELEAQAAGSVEIAYFGLLPQFTGMGLGGHLLGEAIRRGFEMGASRVWVHTCSLDHPQALANYQARGFRVFKVVTEDKDVPDAAGLGPGETPGRPRAG